MVGKHRLFVATALAVAAGALGTLLPRDAFA